MWQSYWFCFEHRILEKKQVCQLPWWQCCCISTIIDHLITSQLTAVIVESTESTKQSTGDGRCRLRPAVGTDLDDGEVAKRRFIAIVCTWFVLDEGSTLLSYTATINATINLELKRKYSRSSKRALVGCLRSRIVALTTIHDPMDRYTILIYHYFIDLFYNDAV